VKVQDSEYKGITGTTSVNVKEKDGIIKATFKGTRSDKPNATIGASGYRYGGKAVKETLSDFEKDYGVKVDEIIDGVDIAEITVLEERAEVNPREGVGTGQAVTLRITDTEGNIVNDVNIGVNKRKFTEQSKTQPTNEAKAKASTVSDVSSGVEGSGVGGDVKSFETAKGSVYTYGDDGKTTRFKTATNEQNEPQDLTVFADFKGQQEDNFLEAIHRSKETGDKVYVVDENGKVIRNNKEAVGKKVNLVIVDKDGKVTERAYAETAPKMGSSVFDMRSFEKDGETYTQRHIGNKVTKINYKEQSLPTQEVKAIHSYRYLMEFDLFLFFFAQ